MVISIKKIDPKIIPLIKEYDKQRDIITLDEQLNKKIIQKNKIVRYIQKLTKDLDNLKEPDYNDTNYKEYDRCTYYYKISKNGQKNYYMKNFDGLKDIRIKASAISHELLHGRFIPEIKESYNDYVHHKANLESKIELNKVKLVNIERKIEKLMREMQANGGNLNEETIKKRNYFEEAEKRYQEEKKHFWQKYGHAFSQNFQQARPQPPPKIITEDVSNSAKILIKHKIINSNVCDYEEAKKKYKRWLLINHPDKGGSNEVCAEVNGAFRTLFGSNNS